MIDGEHDGEVWRLAYIAGDTDGWNASPRVVGSLPEETRHRLDQAIALTYRPPLDGALSHSRLPDGGALLCTTRPDDARVEAMYLPGGVGELMPIDTWRSPSWTHGRASPNEIGGGLWREASVRFARENASRVAPFLADVRRLFASPAGRQLVLIEDRPETVAHWIALACSSLPSEHARAMTFTTSTAYPHRAPQQILGIGPDAHFDRSDPATFEHLYRVHDGTGGLNSPPVPDLWAEMAARLWSAGTPPAEVPPSPLPFDPAPLVIQLLRITLASGRDKPEGLWRLQPLADDLLPALLEILTTVARGDDPPLSSLAWLCQHLAQHDADADELAMVLAHRRLASTRGLPILDDLPLSARALHGLHRAFGPRMEQDLLRRLRGPVRTWAPELELLLERGPVAGTLCDAAATRLTDLLIGFPGDEFHQALAFLNRLTATDIPFDVLRRLEDRMLAWNGRDLAVKLTALQGEWFWSAVDDDTWLPFRLAETAYRPGGPSGVALLASLAERMPGGRFPDGRALETAWWMVWRDGRPGLTDLPKIVRVCPASLIHEARLEGRFLPWLTAPDRFDDRLIEFAEGLGNALLKPREKATRDLLLGARDFAEGPPRLFEAVSSLMRLRSLAAPNAVLLDGVFGKLAAGLARADPQDFCDEVLQLLDAEQDPGLARHYLQAVMADREQHINRLASSPRQAFHTFCAWRRLQENAAWREASRELIGTIFDATWQRMDDPHRDELDDIFDKSDRRWQEIWAKRHPTRGRPLM